MRQKLLLLLLLAALPVQASGEALSLSISTSSKRKNLSLTVARSSAQCDLAVFGARTEALLEDAARRVELERLSTSESSVLFSAVGVPALRVERRRRRSIFFVAESSCADGSGRSNVVSYRARTSTRSGVRRIRRLIISLGAKLVSGRVSLERAFTALSFDKPLDLQSPADGTNRIFVVEQGGTIRVFANDASVSASSMFLDISSKLTDAGSEQGLLGLAFHPNYRSNRFFYVHYTRRSDGANVISRFSARSDNLSSADPASELVLLTVDHPFSNHNSGGLAFGNDGFLYIGMGDGGSGGDPLNHGQDLTTLLGSMLRIDVDRTSAGRNYAIPSDNPFVGGPGGAKEEIFAYGFRNPFRFSFDTVEGRLWVGDVGQNAIEEIDLVEKGKNYGWNIMEGSRCFKPSSGCDRSGLTLPVAEYTHDEGFSITGGYVYRGSALPSLAGKLIYGDFGSGKIWALTYDGQSGTAVEIFDTDLNISSFGQDSAKEMYLVSYSEGRIYKFIPG